MALTPEQISYLDSLHGVQSAPAEASSGMGELGKSLGRGALSIPTTILNAAAGVTRAIGGGPNKVSNAIVGARDAVDQFGQPLAENAQYAQEHPIQKIAQGAIEGGMQILPSLIPGPVGRAYAAGLVPAFAGSTLEKGLEKQDTNNPERTEQQKLARAAIPAAAEGALLHYMGPIGEKLGLESGAGLVKSVDVLNKGTAPSLVGQIAKRGAFDTGYLTGMGKAVGGAEVATGIQTPDEYKEGVKPENLMLEMATNLGMGLGFGALHGVQAKQQAKALHAMATNDMPGQRQVGYDAISNLLEQKGYKPEAENFKNNMGDLENLRAQSVAQGVDLSKVPNNPLLHVKDYIADHISLLDKPKLDNTIDPVSILGTDGGITNDKENKQGIQSNLGGGQKPILGQPLQSSSGEAASTGGILQAQQGERQASPRGKIRELFDPVANAQGIVDADKSGTPLLTHDATGPLDMLTKTMLANNKYIQQDEYGYHPSDKAVEKAQSILDKHTKNQVSTQEKLATPETRPVLRDEVVGERPTGEAAQELKVAASMTPAEYVQHATGRTIEQNLALGGKTAVDSLLAAHQQAVNFYKKPETVIKTSAEKPATIEPEPREAEQTAKARVATGTSAKPNEEIPVKPFIANENTPIEKFVDHITKGTLDKDSPHNQQYYQNNTSNIEAELQKRAATGTIKPEPVGKTSADKLATPSKEGKIEGKDLAAWGRENAKDLYQQWFKADTKEGKIAARTELEKAYKEGKTVPVEKPIVETKTPSTEEKIKTPKQWRKKVDNIDKLIKDKEFDSYQEINKLKKEAMTKEEGGEGYKSAWDAYRQAFHEAATRVTTGKEKASKGKAKVTTLSDLGTTGSEVKPEKRAAPSKEEVASAKTIKDNVHEYKSFGEFDAAMQKVKGDGYNKDVTRANYSDALIKNFDKLPKKLKDLVTENMYTTADGKSKVKYGAFDKTYSHDMQLKREERELGKGSKAVTREDKLVDFTETPQEFKDRVEARVAKGFANDRDRVKYAASLERTVGNSLDPNAKEYYKTLEKTFPDLKALKKTEETTNKARHTEINLPELDDSEHLAEIEAEAKEKREEQASKVAEQVRKLREKALSDLGYTPKDIGKLNPQEIKDILKNKIRNEVPKEQLAKKAEGQKQETKDKQLEIKEKRLENLKEMLKEETDKDTKKELKKKIADLQMEIGDLKPKETQFESEGSEKIFGKGSASDRDYKEFLASDKPIGASPSIPKNFRGFVDQIRQHFGLPGKFFVTTNTDVKLSEMKNNSEGMKYLADRDGKFVGILLNDGKGNSIIALNDERIKSSKSAVEVLSHELGHAIVSNHYENAPQHVKDAIGDSFAKWLGDLKRGDSKALDEFFQASAENKTWDNFKKGMANHLTDGNIDLANDKKMAGMWHEYMAQQVAKYINERHSQPGGAVARFFATVAEKLRNLFKVFQANAIKSGEAVPSVQKWLDGLVESQRVSRRLQEANRYEEGLEANTQNEVPYNQYALKGAKEKPFNLLLDASKEFKIKHDERNINEAKKFGAHFTHFEKEYGDVDPALIPHLERVGAITAPRTIREQIKTMKDNFIGGSTRQKLIDALDPVRAFDMRGYMKARLSKNTEGPIEAIMNYGFLKHTEGIYDTEVGKEVGFIKTMRELEGEHNKFFWWMAANRAEGLAADEKEHMFTKDPETIPALKRLNEGFLPSGADRKATYERVQKEYNRIHEMVLDLAQENGIINDKGRESWKNLFYVPFFRQLEDGSESPNLLKGGLTNLKAIKSMKGGTEKLNQDLLGNVMYNWMHLLTSGAKNDAARDIIKSAIDAKYIEPIHEAEKGSLNYLENGIPQHVRVIPGNEPLIDALSSISNVGVNGPIVDVMRKFKRMLSMGVTMGPAYMVRNLLRDSISSVASNPLGYNPITNVMEGGKIAKNKDNPVYASALAGGGLIRFGTMSDGAKSNKVQYLIDKGIPKNHIITTTEQLKDTMKDLFHKYQSIGDFAESTNRLAIYNQMFKKTGSHLESAYAARDLLDFHMSGTSTAMRFLISVIPFFNARMQGADKLIRSAKETPQRLATVLAATSLASIAAMLYYKDDEDWKNREDYDRDNYWWFKLPGEQHAFYVPKPFELGAMATLAERTAELVASSEPDKGKRFYNSLKTNMQNAFALDFVPQMFRPLLDVGTNVDRFSGSPIENLGIQKLARSQRYTSNTSEVAKFLGLASDQTKLAPSPVQIDHLVQGYLGWMGASAVKYADALIRMAEVNTPARPARQLKDIELIGSFIKGMPENSSRYVTRFYDQAKEIEEATASYKALKEHGDVAGAKAYQEANADLLKKYPSYESAKQQLSQLNKQVHAVEFHPTMSPQEKRARIDALRDKEHKLTERYV